jgi:methylenetetrahydrofolate reductase (NADPH)
MGKQMQKRLKKKLQQGDKFIVIAEVTAGLHFNFAPVERFLKGFSEQGYQAVPKQFDFVSISVPQNPGGMANIEPVDVLGRIKLKNLLNGLDFMPHISCKDHNTDALVSMLNAFRSADVESLLVLTGDKPIRAKGVFELEAVGLLRVIKHINSHIYVSAKTDALDKAYQYFPGAAVSPFKYTEASQMQQYYKMEKKIASGARFLITQLGYDWRKSQELFRYTRENNIDVPIIGYVYMLADNRVLERMHSVDVTGCFISDALLARVKSESPDEHIDRAAQQVAMYKQMGAAGVDIGGVHDFDTFARILKSAAEIGPDWEKHKDNLYWPLDGGWYLYDDAGKKVTLSKPRKKIKHRLFNGFHRLLFDKQHHGFYIFRAVMKFLGTKKGKGFLYRTFFSAEKVVKYLLFNCEECGDCCLPEDFGVCTIGDCEKGMVNAPCGDSTADGRCGNNLEIMCVGEKIYDCAAAEGNLEVLRRRISPSRNPALEHTASILNYLFEKDHTMSHPFISIGESIHASIPRTGQIMRELEEHGPDAYKKDSPQLEYIKALICSQAADGSDYIAVNIDAFGETDPNIAIGMMKKYIRLVRKYGDGIPVCVDSSNDDVLIAGLKEWYDTNEPVKPPMLNSVKTYTMDNILPLKKHFDFVFIGLLISEDKPSGPGGSYSTDELYGLAQQLFGEATSKYGFKPGEIFLDSTVFPLAIDMPMQPGVPGYTYRAFETIKKIKSDPKMKGVHCSLGISNCARDLPGRKIGVMRAYVHTAIQYGCDAGIVNPRHKLYTGDTAAELMELVGAYARMDGSMESTTNAMNLMSQFCRNSKK